MAIKCTLYVSRTLAFKKKDVKMENNTTLNYSLLGNDSGDSFTDLGEPVNWGFWMKTVLTPLIVTAGIIGNILSLVVMKSKALRHKSYSQYLSALAVFDNLTLIIRQIRSVDEYFKTNCSSGVIFHNFDDFGCKIFNFTEHICYLMSSWLIVLMALERLIAVCMPFKRFLIRRRSGATLAIIALFVAICLSQAFRLVMVEQLESRNCGASDSFIELYSNLHIYFYHMTLTFILPVTFVLVCNGLVLYQIFKIRHEINSRAEQKNRHHRAMRKTHRTTCMLLTVSFTYLGTLLPLLTLSLILDMIVKARGRDAYSFYVAVTPYLDVAIVISLLNYAANFFIYILSGKNFRYELRKNFHRQRISMRSLTVRSTKETKEEVIRL
ncbi:growth hormone secretagogue receptor type 1-like [Mya arenaria]|uniref:growth hormone secretagogue receptor type 1-like n=1 Tax=Mya arenaria TaxID=6604 RepID=UPI0022E2944D|nr:growth hormone secretagogue receptor type 1-like [Mya arenaria]